jgi:DNA-directed RNA polymerase specialized sigma24 family protein
MIKLSEPAQFAARKRLFLMIPFGRAATARSRADYATRTEFREALEADLSALYLLAFLLTTTHQDAEQCLHKVIEESLKQKWVFKGWVRSWIKRCLVTHAIRIASTTVDQDDQHRHPWFQTESSERLSILVNAVTRVDLLPRFVFVLATLEGYSVRECSRLLNCTTEKVISYRTRALQQLRALDPPLAGNWEIHSASLASSNAEIQVPASLTTVA